MSAAWETVVDDGSKSVRRLAVPTGWIYQTVDGWKYSTVAGTVGRERDNGYPSWGPMVFVPNNKASELLSVDEANDLRRAVAIAHSTTDSQRFDPDLMSPALLKFVDHHDYCDWVQPMWHKGPCDCRLHAVLDSLSPEDLAALEVERPHVVASWREAKK